MEIIQQIKVSGNHWGDLLQLPCIHAVIRLDYNRGFVASMKCRLCAKECKNNQYWLPYCFAEENDTIVEYDNHTWEVKKDENNVI